MRILGRGPADCHEVLESLTRSTGPILWAVQGFLGGQAGQSDLIPKHKAEELAGQVVVGHYHYQRVINTEPHFRRAFADVFRRLSSLFLGSGLKEDYLVNLFGEYPSTLGAGSLPHYAMFTEKEAEGHADFLQSRLNVTPIVYKDHTALPEFLKLLADACSKKALRNSHISKDKVQVSIGGGGRLEEHRLLWGDGKAAAVLVLRWGGLCLPGKDECVAFSAGRGGAPLPLLIGGMGQSYLDDHHPDWTEQKRSTPARVRG